HRRATGGPYTFFHFFCELAQAEVAWHRLNPRIGDSDDRLLQILIGEADRFHHRPGTRPAVAVVQRLAVETHVGITCTVTAVLAGFFRCHNPHSSHSAEFVYMRRDQCSLRPERSEWTGATGVDTGHAG